LAAGDITDFVLFNFLPSLAAPHFHGVLVLVIGNKFIAGDNNTGVVVTGDKFIAVVYNCSPVSLTPVRNLSPVLTPLAITENP
jgi:hypothetical protein